LTRTGEKERKKIRNAAGLWGENTRGRGPDPRGLLPGEREMHRGRTEYSGKAGEGGGVCQRDENMCTILISKKRGIEGDLPWGIEKHLAAAEGAELRELRAARENLKN